MACRASGEVSKERNMQEIRTYSDGTVAIGEATLPELSPRQKETALALLLLSDIEGVMGGRNGPSITLRGIIERLGA